MKLLARKVMIRMGNGIRWFPNGGYFQPVGFFSGCLNDAIGYTQNL
jgi:hypothetical protein